MALCAPWAVSEVNYPSGKSAPKRNLLMTCEPVASLILEGDNLETNQFPEETAIIDLNLKVYDETLKGQIFVTDRPAGLADVVPVARSLSDEIARRTIEYANRTGRNIPCEKGCAACCRYLVPVSAPEVFRIWDEIQAIKPEEQRDVLSAFVNAAQRILDAGRPPTPQGRVASGEKPQDATDTINRWYAGIDVDCPFLKHEACTIYPLRPIACREHMVSSSVEHCLPANSDQAKPIEPPFSIVEALGRLAGEAEDLSLESVMLPFAPSWRQINHERARRKWPAPALFECFIATVHDLSARHRLAA